MPRYNQAIEGEINPVDLNRDGIISPWELFVSTCLASLCIGMALGALALGVWIWTAGRSPAFKVIVTMFALPLFAGGIIGTWRQFHYEMMLSWAKEDRRRRIEWEDAERDRILGLEDEVKDRITQVDIDAGVQLILLAYYGNKAWARGTIAGLSEPKWNAANEALKLSGVRKGKNPRLEPETYDRAWGKYVEWRRKSLRAMPTSDGDLITL
jgi:hypothetical protein